MKNWLSCFCLLCLPFVAKSQLQIDPLPSDTSAADIVRTHFADSNLVILSAAIFSPRSQMGLFQNGDTIIGINAGWLMSTGNKDDIIGPPSRNLSADLEELDFANIIQQIEILHEGPDAQILDIDFIPLGDSIQFEFVFASEHYEGLECSADYDRLEAKLYAVEGPDRFIRSEMIEVPGKPGVPVNSNTINSGVVDGETTYCDTQDADWTENASLYAGSHPELAFNGFTKVLSSNKMPVVPGQRYNLIISLSEGDSTTNDSGLFLKKGSFTSNSIERAQYQVLSTQYEFCDTLRVGDLVVTEEGAYFARISHPDTPIDTFVYFSAYQIREDITVNYTLCGGDTIFIGDTSFVRPTTYVTEGTTIDGCPQTTTHQIDWGNGNFVFFHSHDLCLGDTLVLNDTFFVASTVYEERVPNGEGCDNVYVHTINFNPVTYQEEYIYACVGDTIQLLDTFFVGSALYEERVSNEEGCDSVYLYTINFDSEIKGVEYISACAGDTIQLSDTFFVASTLYEERFSNEEGCDSVCLYTINFNSEIRREEYISACVGDTVQLLDTFFVASALYEERVSNEEGCDSVYLYTINFNSEIRREEYISACVGDTIQLFDTFFVEDAVYVQQLEEPDSCTIIVTYNVDFEELVFDLDPSLSTEYCSTDTVSLIYGSDVIAIGRSPAFTNQLEPFLNIPDGVGASTAISQAVNQYSPGTRLGDIGGLAEVCLTIEHSFLFDLDIDLLAPNGATINLQPHAFHLYQTYLGEPVDNDANDPMPGLGYTYCWTANATADMTNLALASPSGSSLPAGDYRPSESFSKLDDSPVNGDWKILLTDYWEVDDGNVFDWSLRFASTPIQYPERQGWLGLDPVIAADSLSLVAILPAGAHDFTYFVVDEQGCYGDTTLTINVSDLPTAPQQLDTIICEPTMIYDHLIESGGTYQLSVGLPYFCSPSVINLFVDWPALEEVTGTALGNYDTWLFIVDNPIDASFYLDFGDGDTSHLATVQHTYNIPGPVSASIVIYDECDTLVKPFPGPFMIPNWYEISGRVETYPVEIDPVGINNTLIRSRWLAGPVEETRTNASGTYQLLRQFEDFSPTIRPNKTEFPLNGLDVADLILLSRHLNGSSSLAGSHQILAADIDCSDSLDQADIQLLRRFLLEPGLSFPDSCSNWIFWPQSYTFPDPDQPFGHPNSITIDSIQQDTSGVDFYGIKRGDLGNNASPFRDALVIDTLFFLLENGTADMGDTIRATFRAQNFEQLVGFQFELQFDTLALDFVGFEVGSVPGMTEDDLGLSKIDTGFIRVVWLDILGNAHNLPDLEEAFTLSFVARNQIIDRKNHIGINDRELKASAFDVNLEETPVTLNIDQVSSLNGKPTLAFSLLQNRPNPFTNQTIIPFELPKSARATLRVYNQLGQEVWRKTAQYPAGESQEELRLTAAGLYYYSLETPWGSATKRMVLTRE